MIVLHRVLSTIALFAVALWLGGLLALGAVAAPVIFGNVPYPSSADAMVIVFRRFDLVAMGAAAVLLATEAARLRRGLWVDTVDRVRAILSVVAAAGAVFEGVRISPRIAELHAAGVIRGVGDAGAELSRLHDLAEMSGKTVVVLLAAVIALHVVALSRLPARASRALRAASDDPRDASDASNGAVN
jgi:hypothetical protein